MEDRKVAVVCWVILALLSAGVVIGMLVTGKPWVAAISGSIFVTMLAIGAVLVWTKSDPASET